MKPAVFQILKKISELSNDKDIVLSLQANDCVALRAVFVGMFHPGVNWILPPGAPPYEPCPYDNPSSLHKVYVKFKYFVAGGEGEKLRAFKREQMFIDLLSTLNPEEAQLVISMKDKINPYPKITYKLVTKAFPGLLPNEKKVS